MHWNKAVVTTHCPCKWQCSARKVLAAKFYLFSCWTSKLLVLTEMFLSTRGIILYSAHVLGHIVLITLILECLNCFKKFPLNTTNQQKSLKSSLLLLFSFQINDNAKTDQPNKQIPLFAVHTNWALCEWVLCGVCCVGRQLMSILNATCILNIINRYFSQTALLFLLSFDLFFLVFQNNWKVFAFTAFSWQRCHKVSIHLKG